MIYCPRSSRRFSSEPAGRICRHVPQPSGGEIGQALFEAQLGEHPANAKPLKGFGSGVLEIRDHYDGDTYRTVYTVRLEGVLYILHVFQKKSTKGIATPQRHLDLVRQRLRDAETIHKATKGARS